MKAKRFIEETILNIYEPTEKGFELKDSVLVKGLLSFQIGEVTNIENRTVCESFRKYRIKEISSSISEPSLLMLKPQNERLRRLLTSKRTIRKTYYLYPIIEEERL